MTAIGRFMLLLTAGCMVAAQDNVRIGDEVSYLHLTLNDTSVHEVAFVVDPFTRVGYDATRDRIRAEVVQTQRHTRSFLMWFPGKTTGSFPLDGDTTRIRLKAEGFDLVLDGGTLTVSRLTRHLVEGAFEATGTHEGRVVRVSGRFLLPAYIR